MVGRLVDISLGNDRHPTRVKGLISGFTEQREGRVRKQRKGDVEMIT